MSLWTDLLAEINAITTRGELVIETGVALRKAIRSAHSSARFFRDMTEVTISGLTVTQVQEINLDINAPRFRQVVYLRSAERLDKYYTPIAIDELIDSEGYGRTDAYWGIGTMLRVRANAPEAAYVLGYTQYPVVFPTEVFNSWIANEFRDLLVLKAAANVLGMVGEQEIRGRCEAMAAELQREMIATNLEIVAR